MKCTPDTATWAFLRTNCPSTLWEIKVARLVHGCWITPRQVHLGCSLAITTYAPMGEHASVPMDR